MLRPRSPAALGWPPCTHGAGPVRKAAARSPSRPGAPRHAHDLEAAGTRTCRRHLPGCGRCRRGQGCLTCAKVGPGGGGLLRPGPPPPSSSSSWGSRGGRPSRKPPASHFPGVGCSLVAVRPLPPAVPDPRSGARGPGAAPVAAPPAGGRCLCRSAASSSFSSFSQEGRPPPPPPSPAPAALPSASSSSSCTGSGVAGVQGPRCPH